MLDIQDKMHYTLVDVKPQCRVCEGRGVVIIYRSDLEAFDEVKCEHCTA